MAHLNWKNVLTRAIWTFFQGAIGTVAVLPYISDRQGWVNVANAAIAGGIAALLSFFKTVAQETLSPSSEPIPIPRHEAEVAPEVEPEIEPRHLAPDDI